MSSAITLPTVKSTKRRRTWLFALATAAVIAVPLLVNAIFAGALSSDNDNALDAVPAAVVNNDTMITTTAEDGTESVIFAGRGLVTELTGDEPTGFDWNVTSDKEAQEGLESGKYFAVLTIPEDFSKRVSSQATTSPEQGRISIVTDSAHGYLSPVVAETVASAVKAGFGSTITAQVVNGVYTQFDVLGTQLSEAASGANELASGASDLSGGLAKINTGASSAATGADELATGAEEFSTQLGAFSDGLSAYTGGVGELANGLNTAASTPGVAGFGASVAEYTGGVAAAQQALAAAASRVAPGAPLSVEDYTAILTAAGTLDALAANAQAVNGGAAGLEQGLLSAASGAATLNANSATLSEGGAAIADGASQLASGARTLSDGLGELATGVSGATTGSTQLASGAGTLASGLDEGAQALTDSGFDDPQAAADAVAEPVAVDVTTKNEMSDAAQIISTVVIPAALWLGALAIFLYLRPLTSAVLASSASTASLVTRTFRKAGILALLQAVSLVAFLHLGVGVPWASIGATLPLSIAAALAFTAFHQFLIGAFGRLGSVVSIVLLTIQLASTGGVYPVQLLSAPFQAINSISPIGALVEAVRAILAGGSVTPVFVALAAFVALALLSLWGSGVALARKRRPTELLWVGARTDAPTRSGRFTSPPAMGTAATA